MLVIRLIQRPSGYQSFCCCTTLSLFSVAERAYGQTAVPSANDIQSRQAPQTTIAPRATLLSDEPARSVMSTARQEVGSEEHIDFHGVFSKLLIKRWWIVGSGISFICKSCGACIGDEACGKRGEMAQGAT